MKKGKGTKEMTLADWMNIVIALTNLGIAAFVAYLTWNAGKQTEEMQRQYVKHQNAMERYNSKMEQHLKLMANYFAGEKEVQESLKKSAAFQALLRRVGKHYELDIINVGQAKARNVQLYLDGKPNREVCQFDHDKNKFPRDMDPKSKTSIWLAPTFNSPMPEEVKVTWTDDEGEKEYVTGL